MSHGNFTLQTLKYLFKLNVTWKTCYNNEVVISRAAWHCIQCEVLYCHSCFAKYHPRKGALARHKVRPPHDHVQETKPLYCKVLLFFRILGDIGPFYGATHTLFCTHMMPTVVSKPVWIPCLRVSLRCLILRFTSAFLLAFFILTRLFACITARRDLEVITLYHG